MFAPRAHATSATQTTPCHAWADGACRVFGAAARETMKDAERAVPDLAAWRRTPQSGPWHTEGPVLADHVQRILSALFAVGDGADLFVVEEFAREKDLHLEIDALTGTLCANRPILTAFALVHDAAKPETAFFDAQPNSKGDAEGFRQRDREKRRMTEEEGVRYDKLFRAYTAAHSGMPIGEQMCGFYDAYGIGVHYDRHDTLGAGPAYAACRQAIGARLGLALAQGKMLTELIRFHIDTIRAFNDRADAKAYEILAARARKAGLNVELFLDLALATLFLDAVAGSVHYDRGVCRAQTELVVHMLRAEREVMPERHAAREHAQAQAEKQAYKALLAHAGLDGESVFQLLGTPFGPVRGDVMRRIQAAIDDPSAPLDFGPHTEELRRRIANLREITSRSSR